jgi:hypothetical protein
MKSIRLILFIGGTLKEGKKDKGRRTKEGKNDKG